MQVDHHGLDAVLERRAQVQPCGRSCGGTYAAAGAASAEQVHAGHKRPHRRQLDAVVDALRRLHLGREHGLAGGAGAQDAVGSLGQGTRHLGTATARVPVARRTVRLVASHRRRGGVVRYPGRAGQFLDSGLQDRHPRQRRFKLPNQRQQREDQNILLGSRHRGKVDRRAYARVESDQPRSCKPPFTAPSLLSPSHSNDIRGEQSLNAYPENTYELRRLLLYW